MPASLNGRPGSRRRTVRVAIRLAAIAALVYVAAYVPVVPFFPVCHEEGRHRPIRYTLYGGMTDEFVQALRYQQYPEGARRVGNMIFMTVDEAVFGTWYPYAITTDAIWHVMWERLGIKRTDAFKRRVRVPAFDRQWPTCDAVRAIALEGGKWSREGPSPIWYKRRACRARRASRRVPCPDGRKGSPMGSDAAYLLTWLGLCLGLGLATGYLVATWHGREMRAYLMMWGTLGTGFGIASLVALGVYIVIAYPGIVLIY